MASINEVYLSFIVSLVLVTVLYGTILSPQLKSLSALRDKVASIKFPTTRWWDSNSSVSTREADIETARNQLESYFYAYEVKYKFTRRFLIYFWVGLGLTLIYAIIWAVWTSIYENHSNVSDYAFLLLIALVLLILEHALHSYVINDDTLRNLEWLSNSSGLNPFSVLTIHGGNLYLSNNKPFFESTTQDDPIHFNYQSAVYITGVRYFLQVTDKDEPSKVYCVSFGPWGMRTFTARSIEEGGEYTYVTDLGECQLNKIYGKELRIDLYIFAAAYSKDWSNPYRISTFYETPSGDRESFPTGISGSRFRLENGAGNIKYRGAGFNIKEIQFQNTGLLDERLFRHYEKRFKRARKSKSQVSLKGELLPKKASRITRFLLWLDHQFEPPKPY